MCRRFDPASVHFQTPDFESGQFSISCVVPDNGLKVRCRLAALALQDEPAESQQTLSWQSERLSPGVCPFSFI